MTSTHFEQTRKALRAVIIGYGMAGELFHAPLIAATPGMEVAAIVTGHPKRQERARRTFPNAALLLTAEDLWQNAASYDFVVLASPNRTHVPLGLTAMHADLPVVIDKPMAASVEEAKQLIATSKETGKLLTVFQNRRWDNGFLTVQHLLATDTLGPITRYEARFERYDVALNEQAWRDFPAAEEASGILYDLGSHLIDQALLLFGEPVSVYAEQKKRRPGAQVDDDAFVALQFPNGVCAHLWMSLVARIPGPQVRVSGLRGTYEKMEMDPQFMAIVSGQRPGSYGWGQESREHWGRLSTDVNGLHVDGPIESLPGAYERFYELLRDALVAGAPAPVDPADAVASLRIIEAAQRSARDGVVVALRQV